METPNIESTQNNVPVVAVGGMGNNYSDSGDPDRRFYHADRLGVRIWNKPEQSELGKGRADLVSGLYRVPCSDLRLLGRNRVFQYVITG